MFEGFERKCADLGEVSINYVIGGKGPALLLLHGYPQNISMWAQVAPLLAKHFTVVCADLRGYGDSDKPVCLPDCSNYSFRAFGRDNVAVMHQAGFDRFHVVGHDRGGRTAHRMALDFSDAITSLAVLDIVPTHAMFMETNRHIAGTYWHWYFLAQPAPFPEHMIGLDPDFFYQTCLLGWGAAKLDDFNQSQLADYQRCWRTPEMIHGSCSDYRAAASIDLVHDEQDIARKVKSPTLVLYGANGTMAENFDIPASWRKRCSNVEVATLPGGHFFIDTLPAETAGILLNFCNRNDHKV